MADIRALISAVDVGHFKRVLTASCKPDGSSVIIAAVSSAEFEGA